MFVFMSHTNRSFLFYDFIENLYEEKKISPQWYRMLTEVNDFLIKIVNAVKNKLLEHRIVHISKYDLFSLDWSLSHVILEGLVRFKVDNKLSVPFVDDEDLPEDMSYAAHNTTAQEADTEFLDTRWQYVLDQMIEAFVLIKDDDWTYGKDEEIVVQGLKMFGKYYRNLWI